MHSSRKHESRHFSRRLALLLAALGGVMASSASAAAANFQWSDWWLPTQHSVHGGGMDALFNWIFWITMIALVLVQGTLIWFLIIYRHRPSLKKAHFIHGNTRLEMAWTLLPAVILAVLALASKSVWSEYRYAVTDEKTAQISVIGEQFKWNVIYPGEDGKIGRYLVFPRPSDGQWPTGRRFASVNGPRELARATAIRRINDYIADENPLGKVLIDDPAGKDDDWQKNPTRPVLVPVNRLVEVVLGSKDVLHSFSLPNFRVKLDAVPGLMGKIHFTPLEQSTRDVPIDELKLTDRLWLDRSVATIKVDDDGVAMLPDPKDPASAIGYLQTPGDLAARRLMGRNLMMPFPPADKNDAAAVAEYEKLNTEYQAALRQEFPVLIADLKAAGVQTLPVIAQPFEIVCQELCGMGHGTMRGELIVLSQAQYENHIRKNKEVPTSPTQQPNPIAAAGE